MSETDEFKPITYSFELIDIFDKPLITRNNVMAICPSYHILLDHTIAIIWMLFSSKDQVPLKSCQISWALKFLEGMTNDSRIDGYATDIRKSIKCLQSAFINCILKEHHETCMEAGEIEENTNINRKSSDPDIGVKTVYSLKSILLRDLLVK